jgi:integrative and conjugative element protein (TIGR02256 family)
VLLGTFDLSRSVLHIVAALPAPPDSRQSPTFFIRGAKELRPLIDGINRRSAGVLNYVGEWHSHPKGAKARPSDDDEEVYAHLKTHLHATGAPYVMAIYGERQIWLRVGWQGRETSEGVTAHGRR